MSMLSAFVRRPVLTTMLMVAMLYLGWNGYRALNLELMPRIDYPVIVVTTVYPGAAPGEIESQVTKRIEDQVSTLANIEELTSTSRESVSQVIIQFALQVSQDQAAIDVKDKIDRIRSELPEDADDPVIAKYDIGGEPVINLAVSADRPLDEVYRTVDQVISERLSRVDGVAEVVVTGAREREVRVDVDAERLRAYGLTLLDVVRLMSAANLNVPAGHITRGAGEINVRLRGEVRDPAELAQFRLPIAGGQSIPLSEVAVVRDATAELREMAEWKGQPVIGIGVQKRSDGNTVKVVAGVQEAVEKLRSELPSDYRLEQVSENAGFVRDSVKDVLTNLALGILLAGVLLFVFLHDWRQTLIAAVAMPISN